MQLMQPVGGGGGDPEAAAASAHRMDMMVKKLDNRHKEHEKRMH